jgi:sec-independent protein translocase protein TatC
LGELRSRLKTVFYAFVLILIIVIFLPSDPTQQARHLGDYLTLQFLNNTIVAFLLHQVKGYILPAGWSLLAASGIGEGMEIYFVAALLLALVVCMPVIAFETYKFIDPALREEERRLLYPFVVSTTVLFVVGVLFGYLVISKFLILALAPFFQATSTSFLIDSAAFYYVVFLIVGSTGASFTAPVFVYSLIRLRVIDADFFSRNRVVIWFLIWVVTGLFLTPDGGPLLDLVIFLPIVLLVELAVALGRRAVVRNPGPNPEHRCKYCAARIKPGRLFCPSCGRSVS